MSMIRHLILREALRSTILDHATGSFCVRLISMPCQCIVCFNRKGSIISINTTRYSSNAVGLSVEIQNVIWNLLRILLQVKHRSSYSGSYFPVISYLHNLIYLVGVTHWSSPCCLATFINMRINWLFILVFESCIFNSNHISLKFSCCQVRLIDFGSATFDHDHHSTVVSTRHYRLV